MKKIFVVILFSLFFFPRCTEAPVIISDICTITDEICYYADLVCKNFIHNSTLKNSESEKISELKNISDILKFEFSKMKMKEENLSDQDKNELKYKMLKIRNELREIYEQQLLQIKNSTQ